MSITSDAVWTTVGRNLVANAVQSSSANAAITYIGLSTGCGTLSSGLSASSVYTSLSLNATLPANLSSSQSLTISDGTNAQVVTTSASVLAGATSIPVNGFTCLHTFAANTTGVSPTPVVGDVALYNESVRIPILANGAGAGAGESLSQGYADGTQATGVYTSVGYFGGSTATGSVGTGTLMIEASQFWNHTRNADSFMYQADSTV